VIAPLLFARNLPSRFSVASIAAPIALLLAGAAFALALTWLTTIHLRSYAFSVWTGTQSSSGQALTACYDASVSLLVAAEVVGVLSVIVLYGLMNAFVSDGAISPFTWISATNTGATCAELTTIFGLGIVITALWFQQMGSSCLGASQLGASAAFTRQTGLLAADPRNPAVLVDTLSRQMGDVVPRVLDALVTSCILTSLTLLILNHPTTFGSNLIDSPVATIPLLLRGFGRYAHRTSTRSKEP
jgi:Na+/H+-translocating membrane pyrophosphatase